MNNTMSALYGAIDDRLEFSMLPAVLNMDSTGMVMLQFSLLK